MVSPPAWPERPGTAQDFDEFWLVRQLPPEPFPADYDYGSDRARFGPPGTRWIFSTESLLNRRALPGTSTVVKLAIERLIRKLGTKLPPAGSMGWTTPLPEAPPADPVGAPMRYIRSTIVGKLGDSESLTHTFNWRTAPQPDVDQDVDDMQLFANQLRDHWTTFVKVQAQGSSASVQGLLSADLTYTEATAAYVEQTAPAAITLVPSKSSAGQVKSYVYPRPNYLVDTQYAQFDASVHGTSLEPPLPYEVALALSLTTGLRGPRNRGRVYLGGLCTPMMVAQGSFDAAAVQRFVLNFSAFVHAMNTDTGARLHIVSRAYATSVGVNGVAGGAVPDSQRRRRRSQLEKYGANVPT